jgi:hypothetical protein
MKVVASDSVQRRRRSGREKLLLFGVPIAVVLVLALGLYFYDHGRSDLIAPGVRIDGVSVGGRRARGFATSSGAPTPTGSPSATAEIVSPLPAVRHD